MAMAFRGWPAEALEFYEGLEADNSKAYWTDHKAVYEAKVHAPMAELLAALEPEFGEGKIFRPYRDVRFSADKTPYKTNIGATIERGGYIQLSATGLGAGSGMWMMESDHLARYRQAVADDSSGNELAKLIEALKHKAIWVTGHDALKTVPRGYPKDHPRADLLRNKGLTAWKDFDVAPWLGTAKAKDHVVTFLRTTWPLREWLDAYVRRVPG